MPNPRTSEAVTGTGDRSRPRAVTTAGSVLGVVAVPAIVFAPNLIAFTAAWLPAGVVMTRSSTSPPSPPSPHRPADVLTRTNRRLADLGTDLLATCCCV